jgi:hypothetical protein
MWEWCVCVCVWGRVGACRQQEREWWVRVCREPLCASSRSCCTRTRRTPTRARCVTSPFVTTTHLFTLREQLLRVVLRHDRLDDLVTDGGQHALLPVHAEALCWCDVWCVRVWRWARGERHGRWCVSVWWWWWWWVRIHDASTPPAETTPSSSLVASTSHITRTMRHTTCHVTSFQHTSHLEDVGQLLLVWL